MSEAGKPVTKLLQAWSGGDAAARDELFSTVYDHLRRLAADRISRERPGHTLAPTALVHEAYFRLTDADVPWQDRAHFFAVCANVMRRVLVDHARQRGRHKRGGAAAKLSLDEALAVTADPDPRILLLDEALTSLARVDARKAQIVELVFFGGLTLEEAAQIVGGSIATVHRELKFAKAWMLSEMKA